MNHTDVAQVRALLVQYHPPLPPLYRLQLDRAGDPVPVAGDGEEGLGLLAGDLPDLIFLDVRLPRMDGLTFLERLRATERTKTLPVVIVSNYSEEELVSRGLQLGALEYLIKSQTTPGQLSQGVQNWTRPYAYPSEGRPEEVRN